MKCVRIIFGVIASLISIHGTLGKVTHGKHEDNYISRENDISDDVPSLLIDGGLEEPHRYEDINVYSSGNPYDIARAYDALNAYNLERFYDVDNPFYMGNSYFSASGSFNDNSEIDPEMSIIDDLPEGAIISESGGEPRNSETSSEESETPYEESEAPEESETHEESESETPSQENETTEDPSPSDDIAPERLQDWATPLPIPYWMPSAADIEENPFMGIPAQLQSFPMFDPQYAHSRDDEYEEELAAEREREREEKEENLRNRNVVTAEQVVAHERRFRRGLARTLHLRNTIRDSDQHQVKGVRGDSNKENFIPHDHANCGYGRGGNRNGGNGGNNGGGGSSGGGGNNPVNGVGDAVGAAGNAAGNAADAAGNAVDAVENAADNLRLANNGRRVGRRQRNGNNGRK